MTDPNKERPEQIDSPCGEIESEATVAKGAKSTTVFGALFGAAAAVPT